MAVKAPEGTFDLLPDDVRFWDHFRQTAFEIFGRCGYQPIETPLFEQTDLFVRGIGQSTDVVSKEMFTVVSGGNMEKLLAGESLKAKSRLSLRPEGTAGTVRAVVQHDMVPQGGAPAKLMYAGPMFRAERPQKGRLRQFRQVGVECLGADGKAKLDVAFDLSCMKRSVEGAELNGTRRAFRGEGGVEIEQVISAMVVMPGCASPPVVGASTAVLVPKLGEGIHGCGLSAVEGFKESGLHRLAPAFAPAVADA